jgi:hypothetical protein
VPGTGGGPGHHCVPAPVRVGRNWPTSCNFVRSLGRMIGVCSIEPDTDVAFVDRPPITAGSRDRRAGSTPVLRGMSSVFSDTVHAPRRQCLGVEV